MKDVAELAAFASAILIASTTLLAFSGAFLVALVVSKQAGIIKPIRRILFWFIGLSMCGGILAIFLSLGWFMLRTGSSLSGVFVDSILGAFIFQFTGFISSLIVFFLFSYLWNR